MDKDKLNNTYYLELKRANVVLGSGGSEIVPTWGIIVGDIKQQKDLQDELSQIKESIPASYDEDINHLKEEKADKSDTYTKKEIDDKIAGSGGADLTNYYTKQEIEGKGYLTTETDPTVPDWAKQANKPVYTANEVGALPDTTKIPDITGLATKAELTEGLATKADLSSLNGLATKEELGTKANSTDVYTKAEVDKKVESAGNFDSTKYYDKTATDSLLATKANTSAIPSKVSQLTNDSGYVTDVSGKADKTELSNYALKTEIPDTSVLATKNELASGLSTKADISLLNGKVDKVEGKSLISDSEISRLATVVNYNDTELRTEIATKANASAVYTKEQVDSKLTATYKFRGSVDNYAALPKENNTAGDVYNLLDTGYNYAYVGEGLGELKDGWDNLSGIVDLSEYQKTESADSKYVVKEAGKSLVLNSEIERLSTIVNYDDTIIKADITNIQNTKADKTAIPDITGLVTKAEVSTGLSGKADILSLNGKVDKIEGKGLSTNDYTDEAVTQLAEL